MAEHTKMSSTDRDQTLDILKRCFPKAGSVKIIQIALGDGASHFTSNVNHLTVEYEQDGECQQRHLVMKVLIVDEVFDLWESMDFFNREITMYEVVLPKITKYLNESLTPNHFYTTESKTLVLEDVTALGYESGEKLPLFNFKRSKGVLKALAHFHAASHKLHTQDPHFLEDLLSINLVIQLRRYNITSWEPILLELLKRKNETSLVSQVKAAFGFLKKDDLEIRALINQSQFEFVVLNHGDCRKDNLLLKHGSHNQVEGVKFLDFQVSQWSCPLVDILYFLTTSVPIDEITVHYDDLIDAYLHELNETLKKLRCPSSYERVDFDRDFKNVGFFLLASLLCTCIIVSPTDHKQKKASVKESQVFDDSLSDLCLNDDTFVHAVYGWLKFCEKFHVFEGYNE